MDHVVYDHPSITRLWRIGHADGAFVILYVDAQTKSVYVNKGISAPKL
jgi:hypothetical protein